LKRTILLGLILLFTACEKDHSPTKPSISTTGTIQIVIADKSAPAIDVPDSLDSVNKPAKPSRLDQLEVRVLKSDNSILASKTFTPSNGNFQVAMTVEAQNDLKVLCLGMFDSNVGYFGIDEDVDLQAGKTTTATITGWNDSYVPEILPISPNPSTDGSYNVSWNNVPNAANYVLQEADNQGLDGIGTVYSGNEPMRGFSGMVSGTYYYRVQATNTYGITSGWSDIASVTINKTEYIISGTVTGANGVLVTLSGNAFDSKTVNDGGSYSFTVAKGGNYSITPSKTDYIFTPENQTFINVISDQTQDFTSIKILTGKIAFVSGRDGNDEIYVMTSDGSNQIRLTNNSANDLGPSWSPDGSIIAFYSDRDGNFEIYVMGLNQTRLTDNSTDDRGPSWSPDGSQIAFHSNRDDNAEIYVMDADGSNQTRLTYNSAGDYWPSWSPDGSKIAFYSNRDDNAEIYVMDADGSNQIRLTYNSAWDLSPSWSPDGLKIAFDSDRDDHFEIYVMDADGSNQIRLTYNSDYDFNSSWSPDGSKIAFESDRDGSVDIYVMNVDGSNQTRLTYYSAGDSQPSWSPF
jgi:Tol biopolymer transport system component